MSIFLQEWDTISISINFFQKSIVIRFFQPADSRDVSSIHIQDRSYFILTTRHTMQNSQDSRVYIVIIHKQHQWYITDKHFLSLSTENPIFIYEFHQWHDEIRFFLKKWLFVKTLPWISFCLRNSIIIVQFNSYYCYLIDKDVLLGWGFQ